MKGLALILLAAVIWGAGLLAFAGRGIGADTAARILSSFSEDEEDLLRDILNAEITYARTKRFWD